MKGLSPPLAELGTTLRGLQKEKFSEYDLPDVIFIIVASHDIVPTTLNTPERGERWSYVSNGAWLLLGMEIRIANVSRTAFFKNYTSKWDAHSTVRLLKSIMRIWLI